MGLCTEGVEVGDTGFVGSKATSVDGVVVQGAQRAAFMFQETWYLVLRLGPFWVAPTDKPDTRAGLVDSEGFELFEGKAMSWCNGISLGRRWWVRRGRRWGWRGSVKDVVVVGRHNRVAG